MKNILLVQARYAQATDRTVYGILSGLSGDEREKERGGYYKSLSACFRHYTGASGFFHGAIRSALPAGSAAAAALSYEAKKFPEGPLGEAEWKEFGAYLETANEAYLKFVEALKPEEFEVPAKFGPPDRPPVPLYYLLMMLHSHAIHHRGQISEMLDEMKVENNWSGISAEFLPKN